MFRTIGLKIFSVIMVLAILAVPAFAKSARYAFVGTLAAINDNTIVVTDDKTCTAVHARVPDGVHLEPTFYPGNRVEITVTKTDYGTWNLVDIKKKGTQKAVWSRTRK
ncbi:MAG: hypothetical protein K6G50_09025 [bacterium]|nr:hypothetical protein [bacterium]